MTVDRIREYSLTTGTGPLVLIAVSGFRRFSDEFTPAGGAPIDYLIEGRNSDGEFDGQFEYGVGALNGSGQLVRSAALFSSSGAVVHSFTSTSLVAVYGITQAAIERLVSVLILTHANLTSGVHGISAFISTLLDDPDQATARTTLGLGNSSTLNVGTVAGTVAAGDDSRFGGATAPSAEGQIQTSDVGVSPVWVKFLVNSDGEMLSNGLYKIVFE